MVFTPGGGGGGTLIFSAYVGSDPASTVHPKKYQKFQAPQKNIWNFSNPPKISQFCTLTLKKDPKLHRNDPQTSPFCDDPKKISTKSSYPKKIFIFLKTPKNIEIQNFEPKKMDRAYVYVKRKYQSTPTPPHPPPPPGFLHLDKTLCVWIFDIVLIITNCT